jgi:hypothetical protein
MKKVAGQTMYAVAPLGGLVYFGFALVWAYALGGPLAAFVAFVAAPVTVCRSARRTTGRPAACGRRRR